MRTVDYRSRQPHRGPRPGHHPPRRRRPCGAHAVSRDAGARLRKIHRGPALLRNAGDHRAHLRYLPGEPPAGLVQGLRRHYGGAHSAAAALLREAIHCAQFVQSHALSFFHLSAPDLLLGMDSDPARRNVLGLTEEHPETVREGIALRKFGQRVIERLAGERIHPPGSSRAAWRRRFQTAVRDAHFAGNPGSPRHRLAHAGSFQVVPRRLRAEIEHFGKMATMYAGLVDAGRRLRLTTADCVSATPTASPWPTVDPAEYAD